MQHIHLQKCSSTQSQLKDNFLDLSQPILVSTDHQTQGFGRRGSEWSHFEFALAFSFTLPLNKTLTLTPLEVGCSIAEYFGPNISVKWPNDLINQKGEKVGGILCQLIGKNLIVGVGLNLFVSSPTHFDYPIGGIFNNLPELTKNYKEAIPHSLTKHIRSNRIQSLKVSEVFNRYCCHLNKQVSILDGTVEQKGLFIGVSEHGEALLQNEQGVIVKVMTGSLRY